MGSLLSSVISGKKTSTSYCSSPRNELNHLG